MTEPNDPHQKQAEPPAGQGGFPAAPAPGGYPPAPPTTQGYGEYGAPGQAPLPAGTDLATAGKRIGTALLEIPLAIVTLGIGYLIWTLIAWGKGQTPGKQVMGMRIYHLQTQRAATWGQMFLRQVVGGIINSIFYIGFLVSVVFLFTDPMRRTVPDRLVGTIELNDPNKVLAPAK